MSVGGLTCLFCIESLDIFVCIFSNIESELQPNWKHKAFQLNSHLHKELLNCESVFFIAMTKITAE